MNLRSLLTLADRVGAPTSDRQTMMFPLQRLADQMFGDLRFGLPPLLQGAAVPRMDIIEKDGYFELTAELPGLAREDVRIELADDVLFISGEKRQDKDETIGSRKITERAYGSFMRTLDLPAGIRPEDIEASMDKGVLTVRLPKTVLAAREPKSIEIKAP
ncbi:Hsp20/alpha crystallin family protein [Methylorubrum extorquens]